MTTLAFIGGTGPEGKGLAYRFALAGYEVIVGSRTLERAQTAAREVGERVPAATVRGLLNGDAASESAMVVLTVPYGAQADTLPGLRGGIGGKVVVSTAVPVSFDKGRPSMLSVPEGSASQQAQALLPDARVVAAFQNLGAGKLWDGDVPLEQDIIVCADDAEAKKQVMALSEEIRGARAVDGGPLASAHHVEAITVLLLAINRRYKTVAGIRVVGV